MQIDNKTILYKVAEEFSLTRGSTEERLILQKTIYLLQAYGFKLGYGFSWYRYGPYSQDLVFDAHSVLGSEENTYKSAASTWEFSDNCLQKFNEFKKIFGDTLTSAKMLELVASVDFVCKTWYPNAKRENISGSLKKHKTHFFDGTPIEDSEIFQAFDICTKLQHN
jgi:uncharacterized protein YwgA